MRGFIFADWIFSYFQWVYFRGWRNLHNFARSHFSGSQICNVHDDSVKPASASKITEDVLTESVHFVFICNLKHYKYYGWMYFHRKKNIANFTETIFGCLAWKEHIPQNSRLPYFSYFRSCTCFCLCTPVLDWSPSKIMFCFKKLHSFLFFFLFQFCASPFTIWL